MVVRLKVKFSIKYSSCCIVNKRTITVQVKRVKVFFGDCLRSQTHRYHTDSLKENSLLYKGTFLTDQALG